MNRLRSTEVKLISAFLLVTGTIGFGQFLIKIVSLANIFETLLNFLATIFFIVAAYAGFLLLKEDRKGLEIAKAIIAIQIVNFDIAGLGYSFVTGAYLFVGLTNATLGFNFGFDTRLLITLVDEATNFVLRVNVLSIIAFVYLSRIINQVEKDDEILDAIDEADEKKEDEVIRQ